MYLVETGGNTDFGSEVAKMGEPGETQRERRTRYGRNVGLLGVPAGMGASMWAGARKDARKAGESVRAPKLLTHNKMMRSAQGLFYGGIGTAAGAEGVRRVMRRRRWKKEERGAL